MMLSHLVVDPKPQKLKNFPFVFHLLLQRLLFLLFFFTIYYSILSKVNIFTIAEGLKNKPDVISPRKLGGYGKYSIFQRK